MTNDDRWRASGSSSPPQVEDAPASNRQEPGRTEMSYPDSGPFPRIVTRRTNNLSQSPPCGNHTPDLPARSQSASNPTRAITRSFQPTRRPGFNSAQVIEAAHPEARLV
jgi:hypothetical protein